MRQGQQNRRGRGRNNNRKSGHHHNPLSRSFESNGPAERIRGTPAHIAEKYLSLAREAQSSGEIKFHVASLYPLLYRLEERGWLKGRWVEKPGQRRRRFYSLTAEGHRVLAQQRETWQRFVRAVASLTGVSHA